MENNKPANNEIQIELSEEMAQGTYANLAIISHSSSEFILDFIRVVPGAPKAQVKSRVILTPDNAQRCYSLCKTISRNLGSNFKQEIIITKQLILRTSQVRQERLNRFVFSHRKSTFLQE